jgi:hypothetical protein
MKAVTGELPPQGDVWAAGLKYDGMFTELVKAARGLTGRS